MPRRLTALAWLAGAAALRGPARRPRAVPRRGAAAPADGWDLSLFSPAKVNLFLRVIKKRDDGFHELASLFQAVDLGDALHFEKLEAGAADVLECDAPGMPLDASNLVLRATALFREKVGGDVPGFRILLDKRTPMEAGLGGGSSNAAAALYGVNELCGRPASPEDLIDWSGALGSDITFFLGKTGSAYCTGRGEILEDVPALEPVPRLFVIKPNMGLSTPRVFKTLAASEYSTLRKDRDPRGLLDAFSSAGLTPLEDYVNDLEPPAFACEPVLASIKEKLLAPPYSFHAAMMSGSGTSLFAVASGEEALDFAGFPAAFAADVAGSLDVEVAVWETAFLERDEGGWYAGV